MAETKPLRWGVVGARSRIYRGTILPQLEARSGHQVVAEASRDDEGSDRPYVELLKRRDVDAIYIPLPNDGHAPWILRSLEAGKHVLCEKPLTMSVAETDIAYAAAEATGRHLIEAYVWPHHPRSQLLLDLARSELGALRFSRGRFTFPLDRPEDHRLDARGAGALFDVGIYCLGPAVLLAPRAPRAAAASAVRNQHGVDVSLSGWLDLDGGLTATADVSFESVHLRSYELTGTGGSIRVPSYFVPGPEEDGTLLVEHADGTSSKHAFHGAHGYGEMLDQFADVVQHDATPRWGAAESRMLARWIDALHIAARR